MEFLSKSETEKFCFELLQDDIDEEDLRKIIELTELHELYSIEIEVYRKLGDKYFYNYKYTDAISYYSKAVEIIDNVGERERLSPLYNRIGACLYSELRFQEALTYFDKANIYAEMYNDEVSLINSLCNMAMSYRRLSWLDKAIEYADMCIMRMNHKVDSDKYVIFHIIKINCYLEKKEYQKALDVSNKLISELEDKEGTIVAHIYNNLGNLFCENGLIDESLIYFEKSEQIRQAKEREKLSHTIIDKSDAYIKKGLYKEAKEALESGIKLALGYNDFDYLLRGYNYLVKVYTVLKNNEKVEELYVKIIGLLKNKKSGELEKTYLEISKYYIKQGKLDKADEYMRLSQDVG